MSSSPSVKSTSIHSRLRKPFVARWLDPDVILVGEMRDHETIETALTAETSPFRQRCTHSMRRTLRVSFSSFPSHQQKSVRIQLAGILKAVISMRLSAAKGAGRVPAIEVCRVDCVHSRSHHQRRKDLPDSRGRLPPALHNTACRRSISRCFTCFSRDSSRWKKRCTMRPIRMNSSCAGHLLEGRHAQSLRLTPATSSAKPQAASEPDSIFVKH